MYSSPTTQDASSDAAPAAVEIFYELRLTGDAGIITLDKKNWKHVRDELDAHSKVIRFDGSMKSGLHEAYVVPARSIVYLKTSAPDNAEED